MFRLFIHSVTQQHPGHSLPPPEQFLTRLQLCLHLRRVAQKTTRSSAAAATRALRRTLRKSACCFCLVVCLLF